MRPDSKIPKPAVLVFHLVVILTLLGYGAFRLYIGDWMLAMIYGLSLLPLTVSFVKEQQEISNPIHRRVTLMMMSVSIAATSLEIGYGGLIFVFPLIFIYFFLFQLTEAFILSMLFAALSLACGAQVESVDMIVRFGIAAVNCVMMGAVFAYITLMQHNNLLEIAITDPLTGLYNRKKLNDDLEELPALTGGALLLVDIDHFKQINDEAGHLAGDRVLSQIGAIIRALLPSSARAYRFGGEEFLMIFTNLEEAKTASEQLRLALIKVNKPNCANNAKSTLTCSMGIASRANAEPTTQWLKRTDMALYRAKNAGRDSTCVADELFTPVPKNYRSKTPAELCDVAPER